MPGGLPGQWRQPRVAFMKPRVHVIPEEAMAGAITDGVPGAPGPWRPPRSEYQHPAESSFDPDLATAAPPLHDDGPMPGPWRPPRSGPEVPAKARPADVSAGVKPGNEIATKVAGRNRSNHRALGDHQPQKNDVQFSTTFKEPDEAKWRPTKKGPAADGTGKIGVTSGGLYATTTQMPQPRRKMRSLGMSTVGLTDYPEWQTSTITWVPKEHQRTRDVSDDQLAEQLAVASDSAGSKPGSARPASTASQSNPPGTKLVKTRRQKPRSLGHTAPFLPIKNQEGVFGSSYDMTSSDLKVDKVPVPDQPLQDLFTGRRCPPPAAASLFSPTLHTHMLSLSHTHTHTRAHTHHHHHHQDKIPGWCWATIDHRHLPAHRHCPAPLLPFCPHVAQPPQAPGTVWQQANDER